MPIYLAKRSSDESDACFHVRDSDGRSIPSCDEFLFQLRLRDCSVYTQRAYAMGLAHFFTWLGENGVEPAHFVQPTFLIVKDNVESEGGKQNEFVPSNNFACHYVNIWKGTNNAC